MTLIAHVFGKLHIAKDVLREISENVWFQNTLEQTQTIPNTVEIWTTAPLPYLFITVKSTELEKVTLSDMKIVRIVC